MIFLKANKFPKVTYLNDSIVFFWESKFQIVSTRNLCSAYIGYEEVGEGEKEFRIIGKYFNSTKDEVLISTKSESEARFLLKSLFDSFGSIAWKKVKRIGKIAIILFLLLSCINIFATALVKSISTSGQISNTAIPPVSLNSDQNPAINIEQAKAKFRSDLLKSAGVGMPASLPESNQQYLPQDYSFKKDDKQVVVDAPKLKCLTKNEKTADAQQIVKH